MAKTGAIRRRSSSAIDAGNMDRTERSKLQRRRDRGSHDWNVIYGILDSGFVAHVGFCVADQMFVIPTMYGRDGRTLFLHGSVASRLLRELDRGIPICVTVTLIDGLVLSRSAFDHSMNYRSVVAFGRVQKVADREEKLAALRLISEHLIAGRWSEVRAPSAKELNATTVLRFSIDEASSKVRSGPPQDEESDLQHPVWAGVLPLEVSALPPIPDDKLCAGTPIPVYVLQYAARLRGEGK
jgi:nitroimidazol reductase NimA-like FMN-containing flavoprotein (pyridoxamine 5'-phosphate oxidase superfamily)